MKPYFSILFVISLLSCDPDNVTYENPIFPNGISAGMKSGEALQGPDYNTVGALYRVFRNELYSTDSVTFETIESHAMQNSPFTQYYLSGYQSVTQQELEVVKAKALTDLDGFALAINLSTGGRQELAALIAELQEIKQGSGSRNNVAAYLKQYEHTVVNQPDLSIYDRNLLLVTAGLLRHSYRADCGEGDDEDEDCDHGDDKDWELSIGHIAATAYGTSLGQGNAITCCLYGFYNP